MIMERRSERTQPDASGTSSSRRSPGPYHVPQMIAADAAMDSVISASDAVPPARSRPAAALTEQAEMLPSSQVPMLPIKLKMRKSFLELLPLVWILLLYQISQTHCASLRNYSFKSVNISVVNSDSSVPKNLSELIEFSPLSIPSGVENITSVHKVVEQKTTPRIITLKLKTQVFVQNHEDGNRKDIQESGEMSTAPMNVSESSLADIEYLDSGNGFEFWKWNSNSRSRRMNEDTPHVNDKFSDDSSEEESSENIESVFKLDNSKENQITSHVRRSKYAKGRQFLFHPYLPYGKDVPPDEKISFHDILPLKMVKFVKSMVEEAPWEQMFIKMVRMIVDQFVDKIIEKMFEDKKQDSFKRSFDDFAISSLTLPSFHTPVLRIRRSVDKKPSTDQEEDDLFSFLPPPKKGPQDTGGDGKKSDSENKSWLDQFLDFVFPNTKSEMDDDESYERLRKRDTTNSQLLKKFLTFFISTFEKSSGFLSDAKDVLRYKMLKEFLPYLYNKKYTDNKPDTSSNSVDAMKMTHRKLADGILERNDVPSESDTVPERSARRKRSTEAHYRKVDENRLWQSERHRSHNHRSHDVCSLRKACNAGRLLARLPSVKEITLQLKTNGNEPHWDALIWGMKKKRCSRIFCKRERSPKGSRYSWNEGKRHTANKDQIVTESPTTESEDTNNLTA